MHFGPEWMRPKQQSVSRTQPPPSPPPAAIPQTPNASSYSALVSPAPPVQPEKRDEAHPFRYSKEEMLRIYKESGKGGLGLEVERWEGVVREIGTDPVGLRDLGEAEKKLFTTSLNSDLRRRQSNDYLNLNTQNLERPRLTHSSTGSGTGSPLRERYGSMGIMQRRRDSTDQAPTLAPRKLSLSGQQPLGSPRDVGLPSPRRIGHTPGFDGVLNGGESWVARRRASEGLGKVAGISREPSGEENEIREEDEEGRAERGKETEPQKASESLSQPDPRTDASGIATQRPEDITNGFAQLSVDQKTQGIINSPIPPQAGVPSPPTDLGSVEWSYLDPQGQVQGPFRADLMQKWNDDGYFTPDLLMKRTQLDMEWISVAELARRTGGGKMFLSPISPPMPPGLARRTDSPFGLANEQNMFNNSPYQPSPIRSIRSSTLDSYIGTGSNPSDSPASSFGGGRFSNGSPDPAAFGGRVGQYGAGDIGAGRVAGFGMTGDASPALSGRRNTFAESAEYRSPSLSHAVPQRGSTVDNGFGINGAGGFNSPWQSGHFDGLSGGRSSADSSGYQAGFGNSSGLIMNAASLPSGSFGDISGNGPGYRVNDFGYGTPGNQQGLSPQDKILGGFNRPAALYNDPSSQALLGASIPQYNANVAQQQQQHVPAAVPDLFDQNQARQMHNQFSPVGGQESVVSASPWGALDSPMNKRPGPFDAPHPTATNTNHTQSSPWGTGLHPSESPPQVPELAQVEPPQEAVVSASPAPASAQQDKVATQSPVQEVIAVDSTSPKIDVAPPPVKAVVNEPTPLSIEPTPAPAAPRSKVKQTPTQQQQRPSVEPASQPQTPATQQVLSSPSQPAPPTPKAPWAKDDEAKRPPTATSLRQIQESEAKKAEARKAAEREKEKATRANAASGNEDVQSFTTSWGLPTSQAGKNTSSVVALPAKEVPTSVSAPAPAVWTGAAKATSAKKTMKEIQEEEERRKKASAPAATTAKDVSAGAAAVTGARRGYAESTNKPTPPISQGNAWTTVGPSGKAAIPSRPTATPSASSTSVPRTNGVASAVPRAAPPPTTPAKAPGPKVEEFPLPPSNDFMRWLGDNMKALNSSVNVEEIMHMLLSFPLDPDPSTTEIISDLIYANSTTLDGRRFAADFVSKRKADASARSKAGATGGGKPISIADVVKAQPKQQTSEWGGFKVVNKKKKGGRS
ncbi:kinesin-like protein [Marasmius tenuissimus]|nr:kinesin-like protein [Marasmius tenuissimus]